MAGFFLVAFVALVAIIYLFPSQLDRIYRRSVSCKGIFDGFNSNLYRRILSEKFVVYQLLNEKGRLDFENRICWFLRDKKFVKAEGVVFISDEMKLMIAAAAVQITYGYPRITLDRFEHIVLYADDYYSNLTGFYHEGEVNIMGAIVLSWKNLLLGFDNPYDGRNLLIHEMAHALFLSNFLNGVEFNFIDSNLLVDFREEALKEMLKIENNENSLFRTYGSTNFPEFFSVAVECYFEQTAEFKKYNSKLYAMLCKILNFDLLDF